MDALPNELVLKIITRLSSQGINSLVSISLVNRRLHYLANELLYHSFSSTCGNPALFTRTLSVPSNRSRRVQELEWDCRPRQNHALVTNDAFLLPEDLSSTELGNLGQLLGLEQSPDTQCLNAMLRERGTDAYLSLLLSLAPHVRTLRVAVPTVWSYHAVWFKPVSGLPVLSNLSKAHVIGPMRIQNVVPLFLLPSLRSLTLEHIAHDRNRVVPGPRYKCFQQCEHDAFIQQLQEEKSGIEDFHVQNCSIDTAAIAQLLRLCRRLGTFEFEYTGCGDDEDCAEFAEFLQAVACQSSSLTSLSLKDYRLASDANLVRKLSQLEHTTSLLLDLTMSCGSYLKNTTTGSLFELLQQLPRGLEHLRLIANDPDDYELKPSTAFTDALQAIAPSIKTILPAIHTLEVNGWNPLLGTFACQIQIKAMQLAFAENGIRFLSQPLDRPSNGIYRDDITTRPVENKEWLWVNSGDCDRSWS